MTVTRRKLAGMDEMWGRQLTTAFVMH